MLDAPLSNGVHHINGHSTPDSPIDSPATPVDNSTAPDVKIDVDYTEGESDVRHEPMPLKLDKLDNASVLPQIGTPADPATIPIEPPKGTPPPPPGQLLEDVRVAEQQPLPTTDSDVVMADAVEHPSTAHGLPNGHALDSPAATPVSSIPAVSSSETAVDSLGATSPYPNNKHPNEHDDDDDHKPPAKRARKYSDADKASLANTGTPPPASASPDVGTHAPLPSATTSTLSPAQWRFATSTIRTLKKVKEAVPFLHPVDTVGLNIPHYPTIIKHPMDFSTIDRKLASSSPLKPDSNPANPRYYNADEFIADVRLIFSNCLTFNGPEHAVMLMGKRVEAVFDKQIKQMPPAEERKPVIVKKVATPPPPPPAKKVAAARRPSVNVPVIRRNDENVGRPKREIHPPPPKDLPYADIPKKTRKVKRAKNDAHAEQLKFCDKLLKDLQRKNHYSIAHPFYEPVDYVKMEIPSYPKVIKKPMDLSTMRKKLQNGEYLTAEKFRDDFKQMIRNCATFNPPGNPVHEAGKSFDRLFDEKWANLPSLHSHEVSEDEYDDDEEDSEDDRARMIATMENQIQTMKSSLDSLKKKGKELKKKEKKKEKAVPPVASTSKHASKPGKAAASNGRKKGKKPITDDDVLSFEQKKDLSDTISKLDGAKLEKVIQIIHDGVPEIRDSTEEIELEIDLLPASVLTKLYNFVIRPMRTPATKRSRTGKGTGTGGLKRKSMDEDVEAAKIRALEARMKLFEGGQAGASDVAPGEESEHSSAESSSESSASDSE
ncbi:Bromodomain-containing protein [Sparassis latifolia]